MEVVGIIKLVGATQEIGAKGFRKRELVVTTAEDYPQMLMIEFTQDKVDLLNNFSQGQSVKVAIKRSILILCKVGKSTMHNDKVSVLFRGYKEV